LGAKGWCSGTAEASKLISSAEDSVDEPVYYFDIEFGTMAKGYATIDGKEYFFDTVTGVLDKNYTPVEVVEKGWVTVGGEEMWYENYNRQGYNAGDSNYRGKEIYDEDSNAWYWLDNVDGGKKAVSKDVYQESLADDEGNIGKWVRYDSQGRMVKGWCAGYGADARIISSPEEANGEAVYYFDEKYGTMAKGEVTINGETYKFDTTYGTLIQ
jgi:hypothetical protein